MKAPSVSDLELALHALQSMQTAALQDRWREVFASEPPRKMRAGFLRGAIAYRLQEQAFGGLRLEVKKELDRLALALRRGPATSAERSPVASRYLAPGTRLMREWNGTTQLVDVVEGGFVWRGKTYRTLSAVAVAITGTKWSGPKFFGLGSPRPKLVRSRREPTAVAL